MSRIDELISDASKQGLRWATLGEICQIKRGRVISKDYLREHRGIYPVYSSQTENNGVFGFIDTYDYDFESITWTTDGANAGSVFYHRDEKFSITNVCGLLRVIDSHQVNTKFLYYALVLITRRYVSNGMGNPKLMSNVMSQIKVPIPPLEIQREIVKILDTFTQLEAELEAELEARQKQYHYYRNQLLTFDNRDDVRWATLGEIAITLDSQRRPITKSARKTGEFPYYGASGIIDYVSDYIFDGDYLLVSEDGANLLARSTPIAFSISGKTWVNNHAHVLQFNTYAERRFAEIYLNSIDLSPYVTGAAQPKLNQANLNRIPIPVPPLEEQERIVTILDKFDALVNDLSIGLPAEIKARRQQYAYYRDRLLTFREAT